MFLCGQVSSTSSRRRSAAGRWRTSSTIRTTTCGIRHRQRPRPKDSALRGLYQKPHWPIRVLPGTVLMNRWAGWCQRGQWFPTGHLTQPVPLPTSTSPRVQTTRPGQLGHDRREILHMYRTRHRPRCQSFDLHNSKCLYCCAGPTAYCITRVGRSSWAR